MLHHLTEHVTDWRSSVTVERASRTIRNVALAGAESKNGYRYAEAALKAAAALYENVPVFLDHPASTARPRDRSARDLAGSVSNVRYESGRLRGDVRTLDTEAGRTLLALAEADGPGVGMSHVVLAERSPDGATVERIAEVISVDAVAFPATVRTFRESTRVVSRSPDRDTAADRRSPRSSGRPAVARAAGSGNPATTERVNRVRRLMNLPERRAGDPLPTGRPGRAGRTAPLSPAGRSAPASRPPRPGSVERLLRTSAERLLASVDAELPGHLRRLAAAPGSPGPGRGARVGVFPRHVVIEWRTAGAEPAHYALAWRADGGGVAFGDELVPLETVAERLGGWGDLLSLPSREALSTETHDTTDTDARLEELTERLRQTSAERDRLAERVQELASESQRDAELNELVERSGLPAEAVTPTFRRQLRDAPAAERRALLDDRKRLVERLAFRGPTSTPRRNATHDTGADESFVRAIKRH